MTEPSKNKSSLILGIVILGIAFLITFLLVVSRPSVKKQTQEEKATLVETIEVTPEDYPITLTAFGTIQPIRVLNLHPEVTGTVNVLSKDLIEGGLVSKGQVLIKQDPRDYETLVEQQKALVAKAKFELELEEGRRFVAEREWELLDEGDSSEYEPGKDLALRKPHIAEKKAALDAAKSQLEKAELDLERTILRSPFDAIVLEKNVEVGQRVTPQESIAKLVATDAFQVQVSLPYERLSYIEIPTETEESQTPVRITRDVGRSGKIERKGQILRLLGDVDQQGRMARLLVAIPDPLGRADPSLKNQPFLIGTYARVSIAGPTLENAITIPREALKEGDRIWIVGQDDALEIRDVDVLWRGEDTIVIENEVMSGEQIVISPIQIPIPGMKLKISEQEEAIDD